MMLAASSRPAPARAGRALGVAAGFACLAGLGGWALPAGNARALVWLLGLVLLILAAGIATAVRAARSGREALGWGLFALSLLAGFLVQAARLPGFLGHPLSPAFRNATLVLQVTGTLLQVLGLLAWHLAPRSRFDRIRHGLDGLLFALAAFFMLWGLVLGPVFLGDRFPFAERLLWLGTFVVYDLLLGLAVYFVLPNPARFRGPLGWLAAAFLLASLHNFKWLLDVLSGGAVFHFPAGALVYLIPLAYLGAALSPRSVASSPEETADESIVFALPYLPVVGATALGIWLLATGSGPGHRLILVWLALGLVVVLLTRQYLALKDYSTLSRSLEARVSERTQALEKAQALLLRTERMNSLATLGAGLAHDMNNVLTAIRARAELVMMDLDEGKTPDRADVVRVLEAADLAAAMSSRLMALGRQDPEAPRDLDLGEELRDLDPLLKVLVGRDVSLVLECPPGPIPFRGTRGLLEQILVNLVGNARDAMPEGGTITLRARAGAGTSSPLLEIEDTGTGIPDHLRDRIFQPFFTTKAVGKGTGLGLASIQKLLQQLGGAIAFQSRPGAGTTFRVRLPAAD